MLIGLFVCNSFSQHQWGNLDKPWSVKEFKINEKHYYESTVAVIAPGENTKCKNGKIIVMTGSKREDRRMIISDLYTGQPNQQKLNTAIGTDITLGINSNIETLATDNQIVKLNDGSLLAIKLGFLWSNINPKPFWWNWFDSPESKYKLGTRDAMFVYKSTDCGATWDNISKIDAAKLDAGQYGIPRIEDIDDDDKQDEDSTGDGLWHSNGFDRQEVYYDKWTEKIYITTQIASGGYKDRDDEKVPGIDKYGVLMSSDKGKTWSLLKNGFTNKRIIVMTTNPNGRFFMFSASKGKPVLYFTRQTKDFDLSSLDSIDISCKGDYPDYPVESPTKEQFLSIHQANKLPTFSIARGYSISSKTSAFSSVYVSYPVLNPQGKIEFMLVKVDFEYVTATNKLSVDYKCHAVRASDANHSLGYGTLVESNKQGIDFGDGAAIKVDTKTLFFYLESTAGKDFAGKKIAAFKGMLINNRTNDFSPKFFLSKNSNNDRWFTPGNGIGHYTKGAYFAWGFQQNFAVQWSENDGIHISVISGVDLLKPN